MKKDLVWKSGLGIGIAAALLPFAAATAADYFADRYLNGYLVEPYGSEGSMERQSARAEAERQARGAAGPVRGDPLVAASDYFADRYLNGYLVDPYGAEGSMERQSALAEAERMAKGAAGPLRTDVSDEDVTEHRLDQLHRETLGDDHPQRGEMLIP